MERLIAASPDELAAALDCRFVQQPAALRTNAYEQMNLKLFEFLDKLMAHYQRQTND
ncbi:hypothetical protein V5O39_11780 [Pseudomonas parakoreensis]